MKRIYTSLFMGAMAAAAINAADPSEFTVYINPGHGGHDSDDRNIVIAPFEQGDTAGFWESNANLYKGLVLRDMLEAKGYNVVMSRVTNTTADDLGLSTIDALANAAGADMFISIHSNATGTANRVNFPMGFYRGYDNQPIYSEAQDMADLVVKHLLSNETTHWTNKNPNVRGDWSFYTSWGDKVGLGVLRYLDIPGMLSEGSFHDYIPEAYRLMSEHYRWLEAWHFMKALDEYFEVDADETGAIVGRLLDQRFLREGDFRIHDGDKLRPVTNATVTLYDDAETVVATTQIDSLFNGIYSLRDLNPGTYKLKVTSLTHEPAECEVTVEANKVTYNNMNLRKTRDTAPRVIDFSPTWTEGNPVPCNSPVVLTFYWDMDVESVEKNLKIEPAIQGEFSWDEWKTVMTFTPSVPYQTNTKYKVTLPVEACHGGGVPMEQPFEMEFVTDSRNYVKILGLSPGTNGKVHYKDFVAEVRMDHQPNVNSVYDALSLTDASGKNFKLNRRSATYSKLNSEFGFYRISPFDDLVVGDTYKLTLANTMSDNIGITLKDTVVVEFEAVDAGEAKTTPVVNPDDLAANYTLLQDGCVNVDTAYVADDASSKLFGASAVKFTYNYKSNLTDGDVIWIRPAAETAMNSVGGVGAHIYGDLSGNEVYLRLISADGDVKFVSLGKMDWLGWRYVEAPLTELTDGAAYAFAGVKVSQTKSQMSKSGAFILDDIHYIADGVGGVDEVGADAIPELEVNCAGDYIVANADGLIYGIQLISANGAVVAAAGGNVLNISAVPAGVYVVKVAKAGATAVRKVVITH